MTAPNGTDSPELIRARIVAGRLGVHPRTLARWSDRDVIPQPVRLGPRGDRYYRASDVEALLRDGATTC